MRWDRCKWEKGMLVSEMIQRGQEKAQDRESGEYQEGAGKPYRQPRGRVAAGRQITR